jgi:cold shock CspA family protein
MSCLDVSCEVNMPRRSVKFDRPIAPSGTPSTGRITRLLVGQAHGFIRVRNGRAIFFHRADLRDAATFNTLQVGDLVAFELVNDQVSGARAIRVAPARRPRSDTSHSS